MGKRLLQNGRIILALRLKTRHTDCFNMKANIQNKGQGQIFQNPALEVLSKASPQISGATYVAVVIFFLFMAFRLEVVSSIWTALLIYVGAMFFWTLFEYFAHRYLFHLDEHFPNSRLAAKLAYTFHGIHHEYPRDKERIIMPPAPGLIIITILFSVFYLILGSYAFLFTPGFMTGYLIYTRIHYKTHTTPVPSYLKAQHRHHALHHYKYPEKAFGVTFALWDHVFGTMPPVNTKK